MDKEILDQQRKNWNDISPGWKKWNKKINQWYGSVSDKIIELARIKSDSNILDIAAGTGEPGLTAAKQIPPGKVTGLDISEEMVKIANEFAMQRNITNYHAVHYDGIDLPFPDKYFDAVISRFGIFFFPDIQHILKEIYWVLKPGGRLSVSAWRDITLNVSSCLVEKIATEYLKQSLPDPNGPGSFKFANPEKLIKEFENAGFKNIKKADVGGQGVFDSKKDFWNFISEMQTPFINALKDADDKKKNALRMEVFKASEPYVRNGKLIFNRSAYCLAGAKS